MSSIKINYMNLHEKHEGAKNETQDDTSIAIKIVTDDGISELLKINPTAESLFKMKSMMALEYLATTKAKPSAEGFERFINDKFESYKNL